MNESVGDKRVSYYDWLRIIATFYVVFGHSLYLEYKTIYGGIDYLWLDSAQTVYNTLYYQIGVHIVSWSYTFHMPLFFFLSGAVLALKPLGTYWTFVIKKAKRLWVPYFCAGYFFMLPVKYISGFYDSMGLKWAIGGLWRGIESGHLWFLAAVFWVMVLFGAIYKVLQRVHMQKVLLPIMLLIQSTCQWIPKDILGFVSGLSMIFWFALGFTFERHRERLKKYPFILWFVLLGAGVLSDIVISQYDKAPALVLAIIRGSVTCSLTQIANISLEAVTNTRPYKILTGHLFDIYLYHDPLEYFILFCFFKWDIVSWPGGGCLLIATRIFGTIVISLILGLVIDMVGRQFGKKGRWKETRK